jgi:minor extracellular serine protease Vpr
MFFVYTANAQGTPGQFLGIVSEHESALEGYNTFAWDGTVNGVKLGTGYYNLYVNATKTGVTTQRGVNFQIK